MKQTTNYKLNLPEASDALSILPLNENTQAIDAALAGRVMMASGSYTGNGKRSRKILTPGFKAQVVLMRTARERVVYEFSEGMSVSNGWCLWSGETGKAATYSVEFQSDTYAPDCVGQTVDCDIAFDVQAGALSWSIPAAPNKTGYSALYDGGPATMNNSNGTTYQWIAFGVGEE